MSPVSIAAIGKVSEKRGLSLRFPRFIRVREDKGVDDASTATFLAAMYWSQENRGQQRDLIVDDDLIDVSLEESEGEEYESEGG